MTKISNMSTGHKIAIWALTPGGLSIAKNLLQHIKQSSLFLSETSDDSIEGMRFKRLSEAVSSHFRRFHGHIFLMSAGIVVRVIAPHIRHKTTDPAVVVVDDAGKFAISLLSGHLGGANELAHSVARLTGGIPVITTATDVNKVPAIDMIAGRKNLVIENPDAIKIVNMGFLKKQKIRLHDPYNLLHGLIPEFYLDDSPSWNDDTPAVVVDDKAAEHTKNTLFLRPKTLSAGIGCNRGTSAEELKGFLWDVCKEHGISVHSIRWLATIELKKDEQGITDLARELGVPVRFYDSRTLDQVGTIENPSDYAKKYTGARSVCEAAAILASDSGTLIVPKKKTPNVTIALARKKIFCMS
ncbi:cobalt-precorrin 5A hydrolase [Desulfococcaceae bacterium HSG8]|nr:cobalt-precorrin 5A hydrolase [Desulfococcaceae bacterium HSG8]